MTRCAQRSPKLRRRSLALAYFGFPVLALLPTFTFASLPAKPMIISLRKNASIRQHGNSGSARLPRDENLRQIRRLGRKGWKRRVGYHRRSLVETAFSRLKRAFGDKLKNQNLDNKKTESPLQCKLLNHLAGLGMPKFTWNG